MGVGHQKVARPRSKPRCRALAWPAPRSPKMPGWTFSRLVSGGGFPHRLGGGRGGVSVPRPRPHGADGGALGAALRRGGPDAEGAARERGFRRLLAGFTPGVNAQATGSAELTHYRPLTLPSPQGGEGSLGPRWGEGSLDPQREGGESSGAARRGACCA